MTDNKNLVVQYLRAWAHPSDNEDTIEGWVLSGVIKEEDVPKVKEEFKKYYQKMEKWLK